MKFAKELEQELVPEWRLKYLDYKLGKKKVKAVAKAIKDANKTTPRSRNKSLFATTSLQSAPQYSYLNRGPSSRDPNADHGDLERNIERTPPPFSTPGRPLISSLKSSERASHRNVSKKVKLPEEEPLKGSGQRPGGGLKTRYGSIICSPPEDSPLAARASKDDHSDDQTLTHTPSLELPGPAMDPAKRSHSNRSANDNALAKVPSHQDGDNAYNVGKTRPPPAKTKLSARHLSLFQPKRMNSTPNDGSGRPFMRRVMSLGASPSNLPSPANDVPMEAFREIDVRQADFFNFLDLQLEKIENFYKEKEDEATERLKTLRDQLHIMRDRRMDEIVQARHDRMVAKKKGQFVPEENGFLHEMTKKAETHGPMTWLKTIDHAWGTAKNGRIGKASKALAGLATPEGPHPIDSHRDYVRRVTTSAVPYRAAKRKLKYALQEYYRGLELLKSYALLNRTAFRKINKKYDKAVSARPTNRYVQEKVNKAYFVQSDVLEGHIRAVEDLYARYFEGGNYKIAASKLRAKSIRPEDYTASVFRNGLFLAAGLVFGVQGIVDAGELLFDPDPLLSIQTAYLCQIYGGYFLMLALVLMFCFACKFWTINKVNYVFVFEFDTRHHRDWRQLFEIPCLLFFLQGFFLWMNFTRYATDAMYLYWPVLLVGITLVILFFPAPYLYHHTRGWFLYSNWRLFFAGLYPVEFRDFFMGDMFCSQTYAMGNIELFFCLYANDWRDPLQCNSSSSRLLGFFSTLPGIWRLLQCLRRYYDTRNVFPHLVNGGKYTMTILYYMSLSLYRIHKTNELRALFIVFATINAVYCSIWDLAMDWSLLDPTAKHRFLRKELAYKQIWIYYAAIIIDPILRFNWIYYAIFSHDVQHSAILSFFVAFSEVARRGIWVVFRVENEHCTNVERYRASRDLPLPYEVRENTPLLPPGTTAVDPRSPELNKAKRQQTHDSSDEEASIEGNGIAQNGKEGPDAKKRSNASSMRDVAHAIISAKKGSGSSGSQTASRVPTAEDEQNKLSQTPTVSRQSRSGESGRKKSGANSTWMRVLGRVGSIVQLAHAQDFERRRVIPGVDDGDEVQDNILAPSGVLGNNVKPDTAEGRRRKERAGMAATGAGREGDHPGDAGLSSDDDELSDQEFERLVHSGHEEEAHDDRDDGYDVNIDSSDEMPVDSSDDVIADAGRTANVQAHSLLERAEKLDRDQDVRDDRELEEIEQEDDEEMTRGGWKRSFERSRTAIGGDREEGDQTDEAEGSGTVRRRKKDMTKEDSDDLMSPGHSD